MTYGPPADQPPGPGGPYGDGSYGPPPGANYGPQPAYGQYTGGRSEVGAGPVNPLDWALVAGGAIALIFSFFQYYTVELTQRFKDQLCETDQTSGSVRTLCSGDSASAWHGVFGWFGVLLLLVAALLVVVQAIAPHTLSPQAPTRLITAVLCGVGLLSTFIALFVIPHGDAGDALAGSGLTLGDVFDFGHGFSYWLILVVAIAMTAIAVLRLMQTRGDRTRSGYGQQPPVYGQQSPQYPSGGYGQPPSGYGPPQYGGYEQPPLPREGYGEPTYPQEPPPQQPRE